MAVNPQGAIPLCLSKSYHSHTSPYYKCCSTQKVTWDDATDANRGPDFGNRNDQVSALQVEVVERVLAPTVRDNPGDHDDGLTSSTPTIEINISVMPDACYLTERLVKEKTPSVTTNRQQRLDRGLGDAESEEISNECLDKEPLFNRVSRRNNDSIHEADLGQGVAYSAHKLKTRESFSASTSNETLVSPNVGSNRPYYPTFADNNQNCNRNINKTFKITRENLLKTESVVDDAYGGRGEHDEDSMNPQAVSTYELPLQVVTCTKTHGQDLHRRETDKNCESPLKWDNVKGSNGKNQCSAIEVEVIEQVLRPRLSPRRSIANKLETGTNTSTVEIRIPFDASLYHNNKKTEDIEGLGEKVSGNKDLQNVSNNTRSGLLHLKTSTQVNEMKSHRKDHYKRSAQVWQEEDNHTHWKTPEPSTELAANSGESVERTHGDDRQENTSTSPLHRERPRGTNSVVVESTRMELEYYDDGSEPTTGHILDRTDHLRTSSMEIVQVVLKHSPYVYISTLSSDQLGVKDLPLRHGLSHTFHQNGHMTDHPARESLRLCHLQNSKTFIYEFLPNHNILNLSPSGDLTPNHNQTVFDPKEIVSRRNEPEDSPSSSDENYGKTVRWVERECKDSLPSGTTDSKMKRALKN